MNSYYVYVYCNNDGIKYQTSQGSLPGTPFYVGRGIGSRSLSHLKEAQSVSRKGANHLKLAAIRKILTVGQLPIILKIIEDISRNEADAIETQLIGEIGTIVKVQDVTLRGPLTNLHRGGTGGAIQRSTESNKAISEKLKGRQISWANKISIAKKGVPISKEHATKLHNGGQNRVRSKEENARRGAAISAANTSEVIAKRIERRRQNGWYSHEALERRADLVASGVLKHTEATKRQISENTRTAMQDEKIRAKMRASAAKRWADPAEAEKIRERNSKTYELVHRVTGERVIITNMAAYCHENKTHHRKVRKEYVVTEINMVQV